MTKIHKFTTAGPKHSIQMTRIMLAEETSETSVCRTWKAKSRDIINRSVRIHRAFRKCSILGETQRVRYNRQLGA